MGVQRNYPPSFDDAGIPNLKTEEKVKEGVKHDRQKPDLSLLPREFVEEVALAFMHGAGKYGRSNYLQGMEWTRVLAASLRHIFAYLAGEDLDPESGLCHLAHAGACIAMLLVYRRRGLGKDNRDVGGGY